MNDAAGPAGDSTAAAPTPLVQRLAILAWAVAAVALAAFTWQPIASGATRLGTFGSAALLLLATVVLCWRRPALLRLLLIPLALGGALLLLPGRSGDPAALRRAYVAALQRYRATPYVWGGENARGIDCSGLVRRALIDAGLRQAVATADPALLRAALSLWWRDCTAEDLGDGASGRSRPVTTAPSINALDRDTLLPGDLAVVGDGVHILAHLGDQRWISADPDAQAVIEHQAPATSAWFQGPVNVVRWTILSPP